MKDFKKLNVFQKTRLFNHQIYQKTSNFPKSEQFAITSQLRRASISIATNIAEGCGRKHEKEFARFLQIAYASACEVECLLILSVDLKLIDPTTFEILQNNCDEIKKMLFALGQKLKTDV